MHLSTLTCHYLGRPLSYLRSGITQPQTFLHSKARLSSTTILITLPLSKASSQYQWIGSCKLLVALLHPIWFIWCLHSTWWTKVHLQAVHSHLWYLNKLSISRENKLCSIIYNNSSSCSSLIYSKSITHPDKTSFQDQARSSLTTWTFRG